MIWDPHALLMVDTNLVASETRTSLVREEAFKYAGNPLMRLEDKTLTLGGKTRSIVIELITRQDGRYRIWYQMRGAKPGLKPGPEYNKEAFIGYAESDDGIHFKPLHLKQIEFNGSRNNNIVPFPAPGGQNVRISGLLHDPLDADYPFKCIYYRLGKGVDLEPGVLSRTPDQRDRDFWLVWGIGHSKDGLSWEHPQHQHTLVRANPEHAKLHRALDGGLVISDQSISKKSGLSVPSFAQEGLKQPVRWEHDRTGEELGGRTIQVRAKLHSPDCGTTYHDSPRLYAIYTA